MTLLKHCQRTDCPRHADCYLFDPHPENPLRDYLIVDTVGDECPYYARRPSWGDGKDGEE